MQFAYDPIQQFYYYGEEPPYKGIYQDKLVTSPPNIIGADTETISLKEDIAIGISIAVSPSCGFYFPLFPVTSPVVPWHLLKDPRYVKIFHNALFDLLCMREYEIDGTNIRDTNIMARLQCFQFADLESMSIVHKMEVHNAGDMLKEKGVKTMLELDPAEVAKKCMQDSMATLQLYFNLLPDADLAYLQKEMETIPIMEKMSARGILIDQEFRYMMEEILDSEVDFFEKLCEETDGFKPSSSQQVSYILAKRGAYKVFHRLPYTKGRNGVKKLSSAKEVLEQMDDPLASAILTYRSKASLLHGFVQPWKHSERAYTRFHLDAVTGRPSSARRNMQNIPGKPNEPNPRNMLLPDSAIFTDWDFSQLELRILAYLSGDKEMQYIFSLPTLNPDGTKNREASIHAQTEDFMGIPYKIAKNFNFALTYGGDDNTLAQTANIRDKGLVARLRKLWAAKFPQAWDWIEACQWEARSGSQFVETLYGRRIRLPNPEEQGLDHLLSCSINYRIQPSAAEILKRALITCKDFDLALQVHDQLLIDGYVEENWLKDNIEHSSLLYTPIEVNYETRWE